MANHTRNAWHLQQARDYAQQAIDGRAARGPEWAQDPVIRAGLTHLVEVCAEHMGNIPRDTQAAWTDVPWKPMADYRIIAAHKYHQVDAGIVDEIIRTHLPGLIPHIDAMLSAGV